MKSVLTEYHYSDWEIVMSCFFDVHDTWNILMKQISRLENNDTEELCWLKCWVLWRQIISDTNFTIFHMYVLQWWLLFKVIMICICSEDDRKRIQNRLNNSHRGRQVPERGYWCLKAEMVTSYEDYRQIWRNDLSRWFMVVMSDVVSWKGWRNTGKRERMCICL